MIDEEAYQIVVENQGWLDVDLRAFLEAYEAAKVAKQPCAGINNAALDQAAAARKKYRSDTPVSLYSIEGEDAVFVAAYLEAIKVAEQPSRCKHGVWPYDHCYFCEDEAKTQQPVGCAGLTLADLSNAVNTPDPRQLGKRIIGWRVDADKAGLSDALFFLDNLKKSSCTPKRELVNLTPMIAELEALAEDASNDAGELWLLSRVMKIVHKYARIEVGN